jgi:hypothetical protein
MPSNPIFSNGVYHIGSEFSRKLNKEILKFQSSRQGGPISQISKPESSALTPLY